MALRLTRVAAEGVTKLNWVIERSKGDKVLLYFIALTALKTSQKRDRGNSFRPQTSPNRSSEILSPSMRAFWLTQDPKNLNHTDWRCSEMWSSFWSTTWNLMQIIKHFQTSQIHSGGISKARTHHKIWKYHCAVFFPPKQLKTSLKLNVTRCPEVTSWTRPKQERRGPTSYNNPNHSPLNINRISGIHSVR